MTKGIIKITPRTTQVGQLQITTVGANAYGVVVGSVLNFADPGFPIKLNDTVDCALVSSTTCNVVRAQTA